MIEVSGLLAMSVKIAELHVEQHEAARAAMKRAGVIVEKRAKDKIGTYQGEAGQFAGWAELTDFTKRDRVSQGYSENDPGLRSGEMRDSIEHKVQDGVAYVGSDDDKLVYFELGTSKQPPRSVLGGAAVEAMPEIVEILGENVIMALSGRGNLKTKITP